ncbi:hypothetical protein EB796_004941 [Bugula neritina]|uniref:Uncharacterized protein n=1 Tax=Bugula neritina TaxID=10212 RepID=A0A7J7KFT4_BUGNE|nr:hypothetical protein EB796_004941 [Bugula neritina]
MTNYKFPTLLKRFIAIVIEEISHLKCKRIVLQTVVSGVMMKRDKTSSLITTSKGVFSEFIIIIGVACRLRQMNRCRKPATRISTSNSNIYFYSPEVPMHLWSKEPDKICKKDIPFELRDYLYNCIFSQF